MVICLLDIFIARTNEKYSEAVVSYIKSEQFILCEGQNRRQGFFYSIWEGVLSKSTVTSNKAPKNPDIPKKPIVRQNKSPRQPHYSLMRCCKIAEKEIFSSCVEATKDYAVAYSVQSSLVLLNVPHCSDPWQQQFPAQNFLKVLKCLRSSTLLDNKLLV